MRPTPRAARSTTRPREGVDLMNETTRTDPPSTGREIARIVGYALLALGVLALVVVASGDISNWAGGR